MKEQKTIIEQKCAHCGQNPCTDQQPILEYEAQDLLAQGLNKRE